MIGTLYVVVENEKLVSIYIGEADFLRHEEKDSIRLDKHHEVLCETKKQLSEYFSGERKEFQLPLKITGTPFQLAVWEALNEIPYGETKNYQQIAERIQNPKAVRAVGQANKANNFPIIVPCHRVIGKNNRLTGYAGKQTHIKEKLLILEGAYDTSMQ